MEDLDALMEAMDEGVITCECCGDQIELDGYCSEGTPSPFLTMGLI